MPESKTADIVKGGMKAWLRVRKQAITAGQALGETAASLGERVGKTAGTLGERVVGLRDRVRGEPSSELTELSDTTKQGAKTNDDASAPEGRSRRAAASKPSTAAAKATSTRSRAAPTRSGPSAAKAGAAAKTEATKSAPVLTGSKATSARAGAASTKSSPSKPAAAKSPAMSVKPAPTAASRPHGDGQPESPPASATDQDKVPLKAEDRADAAASARPSVEPEQAPGGGKA